MKDNFTPDLLTRANPTLSYVKGRFEHELSEKNEAYCECCQRRARVNKLKIHSTLALMLARLYWQSVKTGEDWVHIEKFRPPNHGSGRDFCIVKHWGLAIGKPAEDEGDKHSSGMWKLTPDGISFVRGELAIPKYKFVYDDKTVKHSTEITLIKECLNNKFSFEELMNHFDKV